ncbi:extracellular solute-binding protein [Propionibacteriaceae bacterium Y2011]|uniref:extracellular solute-binding protein n=1 Tax=Microlunatus sp. Y2014 TaxID=3418488 RepID=UPI003B4F67E7
MSLSRRRLLGSTVGALALGGIAACSNEGRGGTTGEEQQQANEAANLPAYVPYDGVEPDIAGENGVGNVFFAYPAEPVKAITDPIGDGQPIETLGITNTPIPPGVDKNEFWQALNERVGSELRISLANPSDYTQRFATAVAGGKLPDIFSVGSAPQLPQLLDAEALDLTEHLGGDAVNDYPFLANIGTESWKSTVFNGKIMAVPVPRGVISTYLLYFRSDILAEEGITEQPGSYQELYDLAKQLTNPQQNRWAFSYVPVDHIRQMYEIPNSWSEEGGQFTSAYEHEAQPDALEASRKLFADKLVNPDAFTAQWQDYKTWFANGSALFTFDSFSGWPGYLNRPGSPEFELSGWGPVKAEGGGEAPIWLGNPTNSITSINAKAADRVETLLKYLNFLATPFGTEEYLFRKFGVEGTHYTLEGTDPILNDKGKSETQMGLLYMVDAPWPIYAPGDREATQAQFDAQSAIIPTGLANPTIGLYSETSSRQGNQLSKTLNDLEDDIVQGRKKVSDWAPAVQDWKSKGGDKIRDELQAALEAR